MLKIMNEMKCMQLLNHFSKPSACLSHLSLCVYFFLWPFPWSTPTVHIYCLSVLPLPFHFHYLHDFYLFIGVFNPFSSNDEVSELNRMHVRLLHYFVNRDSYVIGLFCFCIFSSWWTLFFYKRLSFLTDIWRVPRFHMPLEISSPYENFATVLAPIRCIALGMETNMFIKIAWISKRTKTKLTFQWFVTRMGT